MTQGEGTYMTASVTLVGNLTRDPELRFTAGGKAVANFGLAVTRRYQSNGDWEEKTSFFNVSAWDTLAENASSTLSKGARVVVVGRVEQREYETKEGEQRSVLEVVADEVAPSLRWATAEVTRTERTDSTAARPAPSRAAAPARRPAPSEEPF